MHSLDVPRWALDVFFHMQGGGYCLSISVIPSQPLFSTVPLSNNSSARCFSCVQSPLGLPLRNWMFLVQVCTNSCPSKVTFTGLCLKIPVVLFCSQSHSAEKCAAPPVIKVKEDFMLDYTRLYMG